MQALHRERSQNFVSMRDLILLVTNYIFKVSQLRGTRKLAKYSRVQFLRLSVAKLLPITLHLFSWSKFKTLHPISEVLVSSSAQKLAIHSDFPSFSSRKFCGLKCSLPHSFQLKMQNHRTIHTIIFCSWKGPVKYTKDKKLSSYSCYTVGARIFRLFSQIWRQA